MNEGAQVSWIERDYPGATGKHQITSDPDEDYNCIAWAANDDTNGGVTNRGSSGPRSDRRKSNRW